MQPCEEDRLGEERGRVALRDTLGGEGVQDRGGLLRSHDLQVECGGSRFLRKDCVLEVAIEDGHDGGRIA